MTALKRVDMILLAMVALLAPLIGGQVPTEAMGGASLIGGLTGGSESVAATRLILGLLILGAVAMAFLKLRSVPLPRGRIVLFMGTMLSLLGFSALISDFRAQSLEAFLLWVLAGGAFFATVALSGRKAGPNGLVAAMGIAAIILGGRAVLDYATYMEYEPTYRVFAEWNNPNAVAGMLVILGIVCLGLGSHEKRPIQVIGWLGALLSGAGLYLTMSDGGRLALVCGLIAWAVIHLIWKGKAIALAAALPLLVGFALAFAWRTNTISQAAAKPAPEASGRVLAAQSEVEQSQGFRTLLWKTSVDLMQSKPVTGWGPGTFRYESGRPGRQTPTAYAHQTFLQVGFEGGIVALILFLAIAVSWFRLVFKGAKSLTPEQNSLRAAIVGAIVAFGANGMVESNLVFPGIAIIVFMLLGLGLQLSADGSSPELMPRSMRLLVVLLACVLPFAGLAFFSAGEARKSAIVGYAAQQMRSEMLQVSEDIERSMPYDGEALLLAGQYDVRDNERRGRLLHQASLKFPAPRAIRMYARWLADQEQASTAISVLKRAFERDPNNLLAWRLLIDLETQDGNEAGAKAAAEKLVQIEGTSYYQVNSLGDLVSLETSEARLWLAKRESDPAKVVELLKPAVTSYREYLAKTVPLIKKMSKAGMTYGGQSADQALESLSQGLETAQLLESASRKVSDREGSQLATDARSEFDAAIESF